jgi:hypothetical protein
MKYTHIIFNPKKCKILVHNAEKLVISPLFLPYAEGNEQEVGALLAHGSYKT